MDVYINIWNTKVLIDLCDTLLVFVHALRHYLVLCYIANPLMVGNLSDFVVFLLGLYRSPYEKWRAIFKSLSNKVQWHRNHGGNGG